MNSKMPVLDNSTRHAPRITVEVVLWVAVGALALALRLVNLDAAPLAAHEARQALFSWRAVTGQGMPETGYSPFLFVANAVLFALCGASDALARVWPVLFGSVLVLTPLFFRQRVGRVGVLAAGLYLAISPTALFASRQLDGAVAVALGGAVLLGSGLRFIETGNRNLLTLAVIGLALAMTSGSTVYGMLLALGLACLVFAWGWPAGRLRWLAGLLAPHLGSVFVAFAVAVLIFATGLGWNLPGLGAASDLFPAWFARLGAPSLLPLANLVIYEPLALLAGLAGLVWFVRRKRHFGVLLGLWAGLGCSLLAAIPPQTPVGAIWVVLPLALLGGVAIEAFVQNQQFGSAWRAEWVYGLIAGALWVYLYLRFSSYGLKGDPLDLVVGIIALVSPLLLLALAALVFALISGNDRVVTAEIIKGAQSALRGAVVTTGIVLLAVTFSAGWGVAQMRPTDPRELLVHEPTALDVRDFVQALRDLSWRETGLPTTLEFTYEAPPDSLLVWYLRDFDAARRVDSLPEADELGMVVVTLDRERAPDSREGVDLVGRDFTLRRDWSLSQVSCALEWPPCNEAVEWLIRRDHAPADRTGDWAVLEPAVVQWTVIWTYIAGDEAVSHSD